MVAFSTLVALLVGTLAFAAPSTLDSDDASVRTPQGPRDPTKFHVIPENGEVKIVGDKVHLLDGSGNLIHVADNTASDTEPFVSGWTAYAQWFNNAAGASPVSFLNTTWTVPPTPATNHGQTVFLFNAFVPPQSGAILQPVLQWGPSAAGGGSYWAIASWYLVGSNTYFTTPITVNVGQVLDGVIALTSYSGTSFNYQTYFAGISGTTITATNSQQLTWITETLECYGITATTDYPAGTTVFSGIFLRTLAGTPSVSWQAISDTADGVTTTINTDGATNAKITIKY
jgi:hypothetical protein